MSFVDRMFGPWYGHKSANRWAGSAPAQRQAPTLERTLRPLEDTARPGESIVLPIEDARALGRYRYLLRSAPSGQLELAHEEAFESLTNRQRQALLVALAHEVPAARATGADDPMALARVATQAELRRPGTLERVLAGAGLLIPVATAFVASTAADLLFDSRGTQFDDAYGSFGGFDRF